MAENDGVSQVPPSGRDDIPRGSVQRGAKLAGLPLGFAGRTALGLAKRIGGESAEIIAQQIQQTPPTRSSGCSASSRAGR